MDKQSPHRYSTGNHIQYPVIHHSEKEYIHTHTHTHTHTYIFQALAPELLAQSQKLYLLAELGDFGQVY